MFALVFSAYGASMGVLRSRLMPTTHLLACLLLAATLTSCAELAMQAWSLQWHQQLGFYAGLIALQCVVLEHNGFFQSPPRDRLRLCGLFGALMVGLALLRELIGNGTLGRDLSRMAGTTQPDWQGWTLIADGGLHLATLAPGGFILLGLLIAAHQAFRRPAASQ
jgi:electron transport complex protein RnfE